MLEEKALFSNNVKMFHPLNVVNIGTQFSKPVSFKHLSKGL